MSAVAPHFSGGGPRRKLTRREVLFLALLGLAVVGAVLCRSLWLRQAAHMDQGTKPAEAER